MTNYPEQIAGEPCARKPASTVREGAVGNGQQCTALAAYFTVIRKGDSRYEAIDQAAFASRNLYNAANYIIRTREKIWCRIALRSE
jgi:hypothetical protein